MNNPAHSTEVPQAFLKTIAGLQDRHGSITLWEPHKLRLCNELNISELDFDRYIQNLIEAKILEIIVPNWFQVISPIT